MPAPSAASGSIRIDRLLVYLRFARTRSAALALIDARALRRNRKHVLRGAEQVRIGDVLTIAGAGAGAGAGPGAVRVIELVALPQRRGPPALARSYYREVDPANLSPKGQIAIAPAARAPGPRPDHPEVRF